MIKVHTVGTGLEEDKAFIQCANTLDGYYMYTWPILNTLLFWSIIQCRERELRELAEKKDGIFFEWNLFLFSITCTHCNKL